MAGRLSYTGIPYSKLQQGTDEAPNPNELQVNVHLATAQIEAAAPTGTRVRVQLPVGRLSTSTIDESRSDTDLGDLEARVLQTLPWLKVPRIEVGLGVALPTGPYIERSGAANLPPEASYLTLGRGTSWLIGEAQATTPISSWLSSYVQLSARTPLGRTKDEFEWGREARVAVGGRAEVPHDLSVLAIAEMQWRGGASEPDPFADGRLESANAGGTWWTLTPAIAYAASERLQLLGGLRIPILSNVSGNQLVPGLGAFVSVSTSWTRAAPQPRTAKVEAGPAPEPRKGKLTVVDYWATWCAPCKQIDGALSAAAPNWTDVEVIKVDASGWPDNGLELPEGAQGLPVIEIFDASGQRAHLLMGKDALEVVTFVNRLRSR